MQGALTLAIAAGLLTVVGVCVSLGACGSSSSCCGSCDASEPAAIDLSCAPSDLARVTISGPCNSTFDADGAGAFTEKTLFVYGEKEGSCHVTLTFASGFVHAVDVSFTARTSYVCGSPACGSCGQITTPGSGPFTVNNPSNTCVSGDASMAIDGQSESGLVAADSSIETEAGSSDLLCGIHGDGGAGSFCECVGASPPHTLPNDVPCGPTVVGPAALCCGPSTWPLPGSSCLCFPWACTAATGSPQAGCACDVEAGDAGGVGTASCGPSGGAVCCSAGTACSCGAMPCSALGTGWLQVPQCDVAHLTSAACTSISQGPAQLPTCR